MMKKNYLPLFLLAGTFSFAQTTANKTTEGNPVPVTEVSKKNPSVFEKTPLPAEQKASPEIFYIVDDKPVSREEYLKNRAKSSAKK
jgi:hypothetical protein